MESKYLRRWWRDHQRVAQARAWVYSNGVEVVVESMFHLNRAIRYGQVQGGRRDTIYGMKSRLIQVLYEQGYCVDVTTQRQEHECWSCDGTGTYVDGSECWKCDGTGVYKTTNLYLFYFQIGRNRYVWHQPEVYVNFPIQLSDVAQRRDYESRAVATDYVVQSLEALDVYVAAVWFYLIKQGINPRELPHQYTFHEAVKDTVQGTGIHWRLVIWRDMIQRRLRLWFRRQSDLPF